MANPLNELGEKIFLDRYAQKDTKKETLKVDDLVLVCVDQETRQREIGHVVELGNREQPVKIKLRNNETVSEAWDDVDKPLESTAEETMTRVAHEIAAVEKTDSLRAEWETNFHWLLDEWRFIPAGRILSAAGTNQQLTFMNCFVIKSPVDSRKGIVNTLSEMMEIMSRGGGVGINISTLRPQYAYVKGVNGRSSGSVSWGGLYSFVTGLVEQGGSRRGALMLMLNDWHPDVLSFINAKREAGKITNANISVGISDAFMEAIANDGDWVLEFPDTGHTDYLDKWDGNLKHWKQAGLPTVVYKTLKAREVWGQIMQSSWSSAEPGVFFIDRANRESNSWYFSDLISTNPCGEQPLEAYANCLLGALNLSKFVLAGARTDWENLGRAIRTAVRFLDNVVDATPYFMAENEACQKSERRIGLGIMGLAEMLVKLQLRYGSEEGNRFVDRLGKFMATEAYLASTGLAVEKGSFPEFDAKKLLQSEYAKRLPKDVRKAIREKGLRNVTLLTVAPTGSTGTMVGTSTGIEPYFSWSHFRKSRLGTHEEKAPIAAEWLSKNPGKPLPDWFVTAMELRPEEHVSVQATMQRWVDSAISKTCNVPKEYTVDQTRELYELMYKLGCKGGTIYRDGSRDTQVLNLSLDDKKKETSKPAVSTATKSRKKVRDRPKTVIGMTTEKDSPIGKVFVTLNMDEHGDPLEIFINAGKAGSDMFSVSEALGRALSLSLRIESSMTPMERLNEIHDQFEGIGGSNSIGMGKNKIKSMPDAVAKAIEDILVRHASTKVEVVSKEERANHDVTLMGVVKDERRAQSMDICPKCGEAAFVSEEGCQHCVSCGHSRCG
jgi:ribonucleoside-diphosphate reductase alpha chain